MPTSCASPELAGAMRRPSGNVSLVVAAALAEGCATTLDTALTKGGVEAEGSSGVCRASTISGTLGSRKSHQLKNASGSTSNPAAQAKPARRSEEDPFSTNQGFVTVQLTVCVDRGQAVAWQYWRVTED